MSYSPAHKQKTRQKILDAAGKLFKAKGYDATGIDAVMAEAGLTRGGFYAHFTNKEDLFASIVLPQNTDLLSPPETADHHVQLKQIFDYYLGASHRDNPPEGCPLPALSSDIARRGGPARNRYRAIFKGFWKIISHNLEIDHKETREENAKAILSMMIGGVVVSRALGKGVQSQQVLDACRKACQTLAKRH